MKTPIPSEGGKQEVRKGRSLMKYVTVRDQSTEGRGKGMTLVGSE